MAGQRNTTGEISLPQEAGAAKSARGDGSGEIGEAVDPHLLRSMLDAAGDLIYVKDLDGRYLACNKASEKLVGMTEAEQVGKTDFDLFPREFAQAVQQEDRVVMASGIERRVEEWVTYPDGTKVLMESLKAPLYGPEGRIAGLVGVSRDITARKRAEEQLARERNFSEQLIREAPVGIAVFQADTARCLIVNAALCEIIGATPDQLLAKNFRALASWKQSGMLGAAEAALASGRTQQLTAEVTTTYGRKVWVQAVFSSFRSQDGVHLILLLKDITETKVAEAERERVVEELTQVLANVKTLSGLLPVCAWCKNIRNDEGYWQRIETYLAEHSDARFTHGMCPDCMAKHFPEGT